MRPKKRCHGIEPPISLKLIGDSIDIAISVAQNRHEPLVASWQLPQNRRMRAWATGTVAATTRQGSWPLSPRVDFSLTQTDYLGAMVLRKYKFRSLGDVARFLAVLAVFTWSFGSSVCPAVADADTDHLGDQAHSDDRGTGHSHDELDDCCRTLTNVSAVVASATFSPSVKVVAPPLAVDTAASALDFAPPSFLRPASRSTGPPRSRRLRFTTYSPLAPPTHRI